MAPLERRDLAEMLSGLTPAYPRMVRASVRRRLVIIDDVTERFRPCSSKYTWSEVMAVALCWMRCVVDGLDRRMVGRWTYDRASLLSRRPFYQLR